MKAKRQHDDWSPVPVVPWIVNVLQSERRINPAPHVQRVIGLDNILAPVIETAIAQKKALATERKVFLVIPRDAICNEYQTRAVKFPAPLLATAANSNFCRLIHFGVGERFMPALVPSPTAKHAHPIIKWLYKIRPKSILDRRTERMRGDIGLGGQSSKKLADCLAVAPHVGVIHKTQESDNPFPMSNYCSVQLKFNILGARSLHIRIQVNAVGDLRHQSFRKSHRPAALVIFQHCRERESSRVRRIVVCPVVIYGPVHELETGVRAIGIVVEKVHHTELSEADFQPAFRKRGKKRERHTLVGDFAAAERNDLVPHESSDVRRFAQVGISYNV